MHHSSRWRVLLLTCASRVYVVVAEFRVKVVQIRTSRKDCRSSCTFSGRRRSCRRSPTARSTCTTQCQNHLYRCLRTPAAARTGWLCRTLPCRSSSSSCNAFVMNHSCTPYTWCCTRPCSPPSPASTAPGATATATAWRGAAAEKGVGWARPAEARATAAACRAGTAGTLATGVTTLSRSPPRCSLSRQKL